MSVAQEVVKRWPLVGSGDCLGYVGGKGPLASAEFVKTLYEYSTGDKEQQSPRIVLDSDPSLPDRTDAIFNGDDERLLGQLVDILKRLRDSGASQIVICCMTIHHIIPLVPPSLRKHIVSLLDVTFEAIESTPGRHLLASTNGARRLRLFESHPRWERVKERIVIPGQADQQVIHDLIYDVKRNLPLCSLATEFAAIVNKYPVDSVVIGCTELHVLAKHLLGCRCVHRLKNCIDPLALFAGQYASKHKQRTSDGFRTS